MFEKRFQHFWQADTCSVNDDMSLYRGVAPDVRNSDVLRNELFFCETRMFKMELEQFIIVQPVLGDREQPYLFLRCFQGPILDTRRVEVCSVETERCWSRKDEM